MNALKGFLYALFLMASYQGLRIGFQWHNPEEFSVFSQTELLRSYWTGIRFDLSILALLNLPIFIWVFFRSYLKKNLYKVTLIFLFFILNGIPVALSFIDMEYYSITAKRIHLGMTSIQTDIWNQAMQLARYYWHFGLASLLWIFVGQKLLLTLFPHKTKTPLKKVHLLSFFISSGLFFLLIRGGWQIKPLNPTHAISIGNPSLAELSLNTPFNIYRTKDSLEHPFFEKTFFSHEQLNNLLQKNSDFPKIPSANSFKNSNVVLIIMESFALEFTGWGNPQESFTPFLDSFQKKTHAITFKDAFANNNTSIDALPAILTGIPVLMKQHFITSPFYSVNQFILGKELKKFGYQSSFFHGGQNGTMFFDSYIHSLQFDHYYGFNEYPHKEHYDGYWGTPDHYFFDWFSDQLSQRKTPFLSVFFSLSSHQPYFIPKKFQEKFPKNEKHPLTRSIQYADESLRLFFEKAQKSPWYKNTLFIITADHTASCQTQKFCHNTNKQRVPLVFFHGSGKPLPIENQRIAQHADLMPTILDLLELDSLQEKLPRFGQSLARKIKKPEALFQKNRSLRMIEDPYLYSLKMNGQLNITPLENTSLPSYNEKSKEIPLAVKKSIQKLKAFFQYYYHSLKNKKWTLP